MSSFVRASKFRHVFCEQPKPEDEFTGFRLATATGEQTYIKGNEKFFSLALSGGGGPFAVRRVDQPGRFDAGSPVISGHRSAVLDFEWSPFNQHIVASASDDSTIKLWGIPEDGLTTTLTAADALADLTSHGRKVTLLRFHPTANNVLASVSADFTAKIWDVEKSTEISTFSECSALLQDIVWDHTGTNYAISCKDKQVRIVDGRTAQCVSSINAHEGAKSCKLTFLGNKDKLVTVGFTRQSQRQFKVWDPRNTSAALKRVDIDQSAGVIMPFYDPDTSLLYLAGKGDGNIRYYEMAEDSPFAFSISEYRSTQSQKGMCLLPKRACNVMACETAKFLKLTSNHVLPLRFIVPRKSDAFQEDIYPDSFSGVPSHSADEWVAGSDKAPLTSSMAPGAESGAGASSAAFVPQKNAMQLAKELKEAEDRIAQLTKLLQDNNISVP